MILLGAAACVPYPVAISNNAATCSEAGGVVTHKLQGAWKKVDPDLNDGTAEILYFEPAKYQCSLALDECGVDLNNDGYAPDIRSASFCSRHGSILGGGFSASVTRFGGLYYEDLNEWER